LLRYTALLAYNTRPAGGIATADTAPPSHRWLRAGLVVIVALEFLDALSGVQNIFTDYHHPTAFLRFAQTLTSIKLALAPVITGAALVFAGMGNLRRAILALALLVLVGWLLEGLPSIAIHGLRLALDYGGLEEFSHYVIFPAAALAGAALALKDRRLGLAACWSACRRFLNGPASLHSPSPS
jgi:hypothetical protein